jgi:hypothetical protein
MEGSSSRNQDSGCPLLNSVVWKQVAAAAARRWASNCTIHGDGEHGNDESRISHVSFLAGIPRSLAHQSEHIDPRALILSVYKQNNAV